MSETSNWSKGAALRWLDDKPLPDRPRHDAASSARAMNPGVLVKEDADCCQTVASRDPHGRPPIGFCGPECERRDKRLGRRR